MLTRWHGMSWISSESDSAPWLSQPVTFSQRLNLSAGISVPSFSHFKALFQGSIHSSDPSLSIPSLCSCVIAITSSAFCVGKLYVNCHIHVEASFWSQISKLESRKNVLGSVLMPKFMMGWNAGLSFRKWDCSPVKLVLKFKSKISSGLRAAFSGPRRNVRKNDFATSTPMRWVPMAVVPSEMLDVTQSEAVETPVMFFPY